MQIEVKRLQRQYGITTVLVTHDQEEALSMADHVAVMSRGRVEQISPPTEIYDRPQTLFVNEFVGSTNMLTGTLAASASGEAAVRLKDGSLLPVASDALLRMGAGAAVIVSIRPEQLRIHAAPPDGSFAATIKTVMPLGAHVVYDVAIGDGLSFKVSEPREAGAELREAGASVYLKPASPAACHVFPSS
jgi:putative spermidine/putrescine transport system ATP-binding protein